MCLLRELLQCQTFLDSNALSAKIILCAIKLLFSFKDNLNPARFVKLNMNLN